ncbi:MAG: hypothetical protein GC204_20875 [Chloroflexi bacterium]|nr:hypothetical protein [Chloroflexota bacterium]
MPHLIDRFRREAEANKSMDSQARKTTKFKMPLKLYETLQEIHRRSLAMAEQILEVIEDEEHDFMMHYGRRSRRSLPDLVAVKNEILLYAGFLKEFDPADARVIAEKDTALVPADTILKMAQMLQYNNSVLEGLKNTFRDTEYFRVFTDAKASGLIYSGKTALAEILNLAIAARIIETKSEKALAPDKWPSARVKDVPKPPPTIN